jgi:hypothetical protein
MLEKCIIWLNIAGMLIDALSLNIYGNQQTLTGFQKCNKPMKKAKSILPIN